MIKLTNAISFSLILALVIGTFLITPAHAQTNNEAVEVCAKTAKERLNNLDLSGFKNSVNIVINDYFKCLREAQAQTAPSQTTLPKFDEQSQATNEGDETVEELFKKKAESIDGLLASSLLKEINGLDGSRRNRLTQIDRCLQSPVFTDEERELIKKYLSEWPKLQRQQFVDSITTAGSIESLRSIVIKYKTNYFATWSRILLGFCMISGGIKQIERLEKLFPSNLGTSNRSAYDRLNKPLQEARVKLLSAKDILFKAMDTEGANEAKKIINQAFVQIKDAYRLIRISIVFAKGGIGRNECRKQWRQPSVDSNCLIKPKK